MRYWLLVVGFITSLNACAQDEAPAVAQEKYVEGTHYLKMLAPVPTIVKQDKIEVTEIFRFGCPACFRFEDAIAKWKTNKPEIAELVKNPVVWNKDTGVRAQVYYAGENLGKGHETATALFKAIHVNAKSAKEAQNALLEESDILDLFVSMGIERDKAQKVYNSFFVKSKVNQADSRARAFAISGTPEVFVDGRYRITTSTAGSFDNMLDIATFLVEKIAAEKAK